MANEFRQDPLTGDWVIISPGRDKRPGAHGKMAFPERECPFDDPQKTGQEKPVAIYSHGKKVETPEDWTVQVLPNKFPALTPGQCGPVMEQGFHSVAAGVGTHDLVITRDHNKHFANFTDQEMAEVIMAYRDRYRDLTEDLCNKYVLIMHNHGVLAGASIFHNHSQIISLPIIPPQLTRMFSRCDDYFKKTGKRLASELLDEELAENKRIVCQNNTFVAYCPFAGRSQYQVRISRRESQPNFGLLADDEILQLASVVREVFARLDKALENPDYSFYIHTAPDNEQDAALDWHFEIMPRFSPAAGLEFGTGVFVNTVDPDDAAEKLRSATL